MEKNIEVEIRAEVIPSEILTKFIDSLKFIKEIKVHDIYLDTPTGDLYKKGIFVRTRNDKKLDFKFNFEDLGNTKISAHGHCEEYSFSLPLSKEALPDLAKVTKLLDLKPFETNDLEKFKQANNMVDSIVLSKIRKEYSDDVFTYLLDDIENLGQFIEVEYLASVGDDPEAVKARMYAKLKDFNLQYISTGYNEIYWRKNDFDLYLQGRYLFKEDYAKYRPASKSVAG